MERVDLSILIPAYQEADLIAASLRELAGFLDRRPQYGHIEVIVVVAESTDGTAEIARAQAGLFTDFQVLAAGPPRGKGYAVRLGMMRARGRYRLFMDADLATPLIHLDDVHALSRAGAEVGVAVRDLLRAHKRWSRRLLSKAANMAARALLLPGIKDTQCGFKFFSGRAAEDVFARQTIPGWSFDLEILVIARRLGYAIHLIEVPDWSDPKDRGLVGAPMHRVVAAGLLDLFRILWRRLRGAYDRPDERGHVGVGEPPAPRGSPRSRPL